MGTRGLDLGTARASDPDRAERRPGARERRRRARQRDEAADWLLGLRPGGGDADADAAAYLARLCPDLDVAAAYWRKLGGR